FLNTSRRTSRRARFLRIGVFCAVPLAGLLTWGILYVAGRYTPELKVRRHLREAQALMDAGRAREEEHRARLAEAFSRFDGGAMESAEHSWSGALVLVQELGHIYVRSGGSRTR